MIITTVKIKYNYFNVTYKHMLFHNVKLITYSNPEDQRRTQEELIGLIKMVRIEHRKFV